MCHRVHTSASEIPTGLDFGGNRANALIVGKAGADGGDVQLCYVCHGVDSLGSSDDVQSQFESGSSHRLTPDSSSYGPSYKECSDCHDSHGSTKRSDGSPYPALLRSRSATGGLVYSGSEYCATCHVARKGNEFPGLAVWNKTAHANIAPPASGTGIVCSVCHTPHGSPIAPNIVSAIAPPSVSATTAITANDRGLCVVCHATPERTWEGTATYSLSAHGSTAATVSVSGQWASKDTSRSAGECQSCHAPMGASDGKGGAVPRLAKKVGSALCYDCHRSGGAASTNLESLGYAPAPVVSTVVGYGSGPGTDEFGELETFTRDDSSSPTISGPRSFASGRIGAIATGDIDGTGSTELVVARAGTSRVTVFSDSEFSGLAPQPGDRTLLAPAKYLAVADVLDDAYGCDELVTASGSTVRVYRWNVGDAAFDAITALALPGSITGLAAGRILGNSRADIAVTTNGPDRLVVLTQDTPTTLSVAGSYPTRALPRSPSIGRADSDGHGYVVVANGGEISPILSVFSRNGTETASGGSTTDASPTATAVGNVLPGISESGTLGDEVAVTLGSSSGSEKVDVFPLGGSGLGAPVTHTFAAHSDPDSLAVGDVDGDGRAELIVGLGGQRANLASDAKAPSLAIVHASADGTGLGVVDERSGGGVELAGTTHVLAANLGAIGPSRHPVEAAQEAHVSTETAPFPEHVACVDCHNVHAATSTVATAPTLPGALVGAWGVSLTGSTPTLNTNVTAEYQVCLKCHASYDGWTALSGVRPVDGELRTTNPSFHPVEGVSPSTNATGQTLVSGLTPSSRVNCTDCHGNSDGRGTSAVGQPNGPHSSPSAPLLVKPLLGASAGDAGALCYACHSYEVYGNGSADGQATRSSGFIDASSNAKLHSSHVVRGFSCLSCHVSHGSTTEPFGLRSDVGWAADSSGKGGGSCTNGCHGGVNKSYHR
jgi:predicted CXXCH cytochrome family protein